MKIDENTMKQIEQDLQLSAFYRKGIKVPIKNCWHFSTNGNDINVIFYNKQDFVDGMNRIYTVSKTFNVIILAFALMDNHFHFILYGSYNECNKFVHEYVKRTSMHIFKQHGDRHKMEKVSIDYQEVGDELYLKTVICYTIKNPPVAGVRSNAFDYPWSSGSLYFREEDTWTSPIWKMTGCLRKMVEIIPSQKQRKEQFHSNDDFGDDILLCNGMIFPGEYVAYEVVERVFVSNKSYNYFLCKTKEEDVELKRSNISFLSIPDQEMRQHKLEMCRSMFGVDTVRKLNVNQRIMLARNLKSKYNCSLRQIAGLCGIKFDDLKKII